MAGSLPTISPDRRPWVVVMLKEPRPGRVKTRLGRDIGMTAAAWWFRHQCRRLWRELDDPRWRLVIAVSPDAEGRGDLGARMGRLFRHLPPGPVVIVGADIPGRCGATTLPAPSPLSGQPRRFSVRPRMAAIG